MYVQFDGRLMPIAFIPVFGCCCSCTEEPSDEGTQLVSNDMVMYMLCWLVFGNIECIDVLGCVPPPAFNPKFLGQNRGIQGHQNSCYMDATLFSMFAFSMVFDSILHRPRRSSCSSSYYDEVQRTLREGIANPLRK